MSLSFYKDKTVLVTGAGGSIGSEVCRQLLNLYPNVKRLVMLDNSELALYNIARELQTVKAHPILADITHSADLTRALRNKPDVIIHAAAYKHVTLCENNHEVAYRVNVDATRDLADWAKIWRVPTFVLVSTDKAVNPTCVMGATKKLAEESVRWRGYSVVRLGNVRGSSGSVLPLWKEQIANGEAVTITDPSATRYFISAINAARRILAVAVLPPDTYVPEMGEPLMMGEEALRLGAKNIKVIGLRPGEKKHEELFAGERACTPYPGIWRDAA